jgi:redox-sensitive bicupin YhaK (pirin superfamily)
MVVFRRSGERGHADHGWLRSFHTFSFADYYDPDRMGVGPLRVINEDTVAPNRGFGTHSHRDMEIISYVLEGQLAHRDSLGHSATIAPGTVQRMSAGTGIEHSEFNPSGLELLHFLQIWIVPRRKGERPRYDELSFDLCATTAVVRDLVSGDGAGGTIPIDQDAKVSVALLPSGGGTLEVPLDPDRTCYVHVAKGSATVAGQSLRAGDAATLTHQSGVVFEDGDNAQVLIFDLPGQ